MIRAVLFDFDGTLVHTAPGILEGFRHALAQEGVAPVTAIDERVIGPPLVATLSRLTGVNDPALLDRLATAFKASYDTVGVLHSDPYPGLAECLTALRAAGRDVYIVTNKRELPARLIADRLGITPHLAALYAVDTIQPPLGKKRLVAAHVLRTHGIDPAAAVMVGDSADDGDAAVANGMRFVAATYGYGDPVAAVPAGTALPISRLADLPALLARLD